ncbi:MAG: hypothetical protein ACLVL7_11370 [Anaerotruncus massiliensis (ex Togo et al. 2019)]
MRRGRRELTPELAVRIGCGRHPRQGPPGRRGDGDARCAKVLGAALIAGVRSTGAPVLDFGSVFEALFGFAMGYNALTLGVYLCAGEQNAIKVLCEAGLPATRRVEREIELALSRGSSPAREGEQVRRLRGHERHRGHVPDRAAAAGPRRARRDARAGRLRQRRRGAAALRRADEARLRDRGGGGAAAHPLGGRAAAGALGGGDEARVPPGGGGVVPRAVRAAGGRRGG